MAFALALVKLEATKSKGAGDRRLKGEADHVGRKD
jgi:hypothetical protein